MKDHEIASVVLIVWALSDSQPGSDESNATGYSGFGVDSNALSSRQSFRLSSNGGISWNTIDFRADSPSERIYSGGSIQSESYFKIRIGSDEFIFKKSGSSFSVDSPRSGSVSVSKDGSSSVKVRFSDGTTSIFQIS